VSRTVAIDLPATTPAPWPAPRESTWELRPGDVIAPGRHVVRRLAGGGAHEAFLVRTGGVPRLAVAKLPRPHLAEDPHCLLRLRNEGRALERLAHPGLPRHFDTVLSGPHPHMLLEYMPGTTLAGTFAARRPLCPPVVAHLGHALARTLDHIARAGWVHLDIKPSNIVTGDAPGLLDFELARTVADAAGMTRPTGTWAYMPPEQRAAGAAGEPVGPPADVFALAMSLGEALSGHSFARRPAAPLGPVGAVLHEALAPRPGDRPTAAELAAGLAGVAEPSTTLAAAA
jgi:eukaryotic-like serine/threonine-protein kinase